LDLWHDRHYLDLGNGMTPQEQDDEKVRRDLEAIARSVDAQLPFGWGFVVLAFPFGAGAG
jgi:hypothetical protein